MIEFRGWPKTPRLFRDMIVTEKIDGTNACVIIEPAGSAAQADGPPAAIMQGAFSYVWPDDVDYWIAAQSRNRLITPENDNAGFAKWVEANAFALAKTLGPGYHYGEWWGQGIQRGYGLSEKRFSLFNAVRWAEQKFDGTQVPGLHVVPTLLQNTFNTADVTNVLIDLMNGGSQAAPGFMTPEGVVVYHAASGQLFKALIEADSEPKSKREQVLAA